MDFSGEVTIAIVGSGFAGLGMGIRLKEKGIEDFLIFERAGDVGGVWRDNSYPGCACDVESHLYSFSFAPNPQWSRMFSTQPEIYQYLKDCAQRYRLRPHLKFNHDFLSANWDPDLQRWKIKTSQGTYLAKFLVSAMGAFSEPFIPTLPGLKNFKGKTFHSAQWDHSFDLKDKRVAVVGTGASAIQFVPEIQPQVKKLTLFQRTPAWIMMRPDRPIEDKEREKFAKRPFLQKLSRLRIYILRELYGLTFRHPRFMGFGTQMALHHMKKAIKDPDLRKKLTPQYTIGCKRILLSNNFYPAIARDNVEVVTEAISEIQAHSIKTSDGHEHEVDAIIFGTGFRVTDFPLSKKVFDQDGRTLEQVWNGSPKAFLGTTVSGFPNFFLLLGPNTGLGHTSVVIMIETQIEHAVKAIGYFLKRKLGAMEPRAEKEEAFIQSIDADSKKTVWLSGCKSWYLDQKGRNSSLWPKSVGAFMRRVKPFRKKDYQFWDQKKEALP